MKKLINQWRDFAHDESGAAAVEYGLLAGLIAVFIATSVAAYVYAWRKGVFRWD